MKRTLSLKSETLTELGADDLALVNGGNDTRNCASRDCYTVGAVCFVSLAICEIVETLQ